MEGEKIIESITKTINERLKVPIIITYLSVLILYNWDILFYLIFGKENASIKIDYIKDEYSSDYWCRILSCIIISILLIVAFAIINTGLNYLLKWFYRKDKEITSEINDFETIKNKNQQLVNSIDEINKLKIEVENLTKINDELNLKSKEISISDIAKKDFEILNSKLSSIQHKEKLLYSLKELIEFLKNEPDIETHDIYRQATYSLEMAELIGILEDFKLVQENFVGYDTFSNPISTLKIGTSFKEFLKMNLN